MPDLVTQPSAEPTRKTTAAIIGAALATIVCWAVQQFGGVEIPPGIEAAAATLFTVGCAYFTMERGTVEPRPVEFKE